ncbi:response regulator [Acetobacter lovaniensis]|jgi:CheY-like chemotaxis protein|uniref:response regulator n=1 Tax=Acetobacter lovaniensis TaxID=104100 RepID=UPI0020A19482|nr:response regulator [Acetobacter lovaniensis]MCP1240906.1 response regulator [Acetobacter lovaniensis]
MAKTTASKTVVLIDDELHNMTWMVDYLSSRGLLTLTASNANDAVAILEQEIYRAIIVDLNIPIMDPLTNTALAKGEIYGRFPGLYVASYARNKGYRDRQVVLYSVHRDAAVSEEAARLGCTYIIKGRPKEIKLELDAVVSFDPTLP